MPKRKPYIRKAGMKWTEPNCDRLRRLVAEKTPTKTIALKLGRTEIAVRRKVESLGLSLKPRDKKPMTADAIAGEQAQVEPPPRWWQFWRWL